MPVVSAACWAIQLKRHSSPGLIGFMVAGDGHGRAMSMRRLSNTSALQFANDVAWSGMNGTQRLR